MESAPGQMMFYAVAGDMGEDGGDGEGHECPAETNVVTNCTSSVILLTNMTTTVGEILVPQMGVTSTSVDLGATVHIVSNGLHQIITTATPCFVCSGGETEPRVTTNEATITPSVFVWNWQVATNSGTKVDDLSFATNVIVDLPKNYPISIKAVATNMPDCCAECAASVSTNALVMKLKSEMVMEFPKPVERLKVGVGEDVNLSMLLEEYAEETVWKITNGDGKLSSTNGASITFTAPSQPWIGSTTITASINGLGASLSFEIVPPSTIKFENTYEPQGDLPGKGTGNAPPQVNPAYNYYKLNYQANYYVGPDDVNFHNILVSEGAANLMRAPGYWTTYPKEGNDHASWNDKPPAGPGGEGPKPLTTTVVPQKGTKCVVFDDITGGATTSPFESGCAYWSIPWYFQVGNNGWQLEFCRVIEDFELESIGMINGVEGFKFTIKKGDFSGWSISYGEQTPQEEQPKP